MHFPMRCACRFAMIFAVASCAQAQAGYTFSEIGVPGAVSISANGINDSGQITGSFVDSSSLTHGYLASGQAITTIDVKKALQGTTVVTGINGAGQIVGSFTNDNSVTKGFVDNDGVFSTIDPPKSILRAWNEIIAPSSRRGT
jgi:hypothetical protein